MASLSCAVTLGGVPLGPIGQAGARGQSSPPPTQQPVFRSGIDIVQVDVSVLDRDRLPLRHLTAADFTVLEEGKPQEIVVVAPVDTPMVDLPATPWIREVPPDVRTNDLGDARLFAIILDDALSALDEATQAALFAHLRAELPNAIIVSLAQRPAAWDVKDRQLCLERNGESSILRAAGRPSMAVAQ